jgi:hypothetical protein
VSSCAPWGSLADNSNQTAIKDKAVDDKAAENDRYASSRESFLVPKGTSEWDRKKGVYEGRF